MCEKRSCRQTEIERANTHTHTQWIKSRLHCIHSFTQMSLHTSHSMTVTLINKVLKYSTVFSNLHFTRNLHVWANYLHILGVKKKRSANCQRAHKFPQHVKASVGLTVILAEWAPCETSLCSWSVCTRVCARAWFYPYMNRFPPRFRLEHKIFQTSHWSAPHQHPPILPHLAYLFFLWLSVISPRFPSSSASVPLHSHPSFPPSLHPLPSSYQI